jgi:hypothetical protein
MIIGKDVLVMGGKDLFRYWPLANYAYGRLH